MSISALRRIAAWIDLSDPTVSLCIEHTQVAVIFFAIVPAKDVKFLIKQSGGMILNLGSLNTLIIPKPSLSILLIVLWVRQIIEKSAETASHILRLSLVFVAFSNEDPFQSLRHLFSATPSTRRSDREVIIRRIVAMDLVGLRRVARDQGAIADDRWVLIVVMRVLLLVEHHVGEIVLGKVLRGFVDFEIVFIIIILLGVVYTLINRLNAIIMLVLQLNIQFQFLPIDIELVSLTVRSSILYKILRLVGTYDLTFNGLPLGCDLDILILSGVIRIFIVIILTDFLGDLICHPLPQLDLLISFLFFAFLYLFGSVNLIFEGGRGREGR